MPILAFEKVTAARLGRLQSVPVTVQASALVNASQSNLDVPGCSITFITQTASAQVKIEWSTDFRGTGAAAAASNCRPLVDGTGVPVFTIWQPSATGQSATCSNTWTATLAAAGSHTIKLQATTSTNTVIQVYTTLTITVSEVV
jgi:hypothetical protein